MKSSRVKWVAAGVMLLALSGFGWEIGEPMVSYWAGPGWPGRPLTDANAKQLKDGGFNVVWGCSTNDLDIAQKYGLRVIYDLRIRKGLANADSRARLMARINDAVISHPALYLYHHADEPAATQFVALAAVRDWVAKRDPKHPMWVNLLPTYARNHQLGVEGPIIRAYYEHVRLFGEIYRPELLSYDHYQFNVGGDTRDYFLNLSIMREAAESLGVPFVNGVQACTWRPGSLASPAAPRIPNADELRYLAYTTLAYGAQGIYYYVYSHPSHAGTIVEPDGTPGPNYEPLKVINRDFVAIAKETRKYRLAGVYAAGGQASGLTPYCDAAGLKLEPTVPTYYPEKSGYLADTTLIARFVATNGGSQAFLVVNADYRKAREVTVSAPVELERFDPANGTWTKVGASAVLALPKGGGFLLVCYNF